MARRLSPGLYAITDCAHLPFEQTVERTAAILSAGVAALQYRNKSADAGTRREQASVLAALCHRHRTPLIVNDDPDIAARTGAAGVHLGRDDPSCADARRRLGPDALIGVSCYDDLELALSARDEGADYVAFGAFFATSTKAASARPQPTLLTRARTLLQIPIVAIGGITVENAGMLLAAGADNLAVVNSLYGADDSAAAVRQFQAVFGTGPRTYGDWGEQSTV